MTWFEQLTGFPEISPTAVRQNLKIEGDTMTSLVNGRRWSYGRLETPSLAELRQRVEASAKPTGRISVREVVADTRDLHADISNADSVFQVASQFNLLEMVGPNTPPEDGVGIYEDDLTQGPACAIAAGAGTIYRNYFANVNGQIGQSRNNQIDCLAELGRKLGNTDNRLWEMRNGYALATRSGLNEISTRLRSLNESQLDELRQSLRIGLQWNTQVTVNASTHAVSQAYCSAVPVAYCSHPAHLWGSLARLVLDAAYEATICAAILNMQNTGNNRVFLTLIGGGAFGNEPDWILKAIKHAFRIYEHWNLDVAIVSYGWPQPPVQKLAEQFSHD